jgi:Flp pilus assembly protein TadG
MTARKPMINRSLFARLWRAGEGTAAVETGILLPIYLLFLLGIFEFGRLLWTQVSLQYAVEAAVRCAIIDPTTCGTSSAVATYAANQAFGLSIPSSAFT